MVSSWVSVETALQTTVKKQGHVIQFSKSPIVSRAPSFVDLVRWSPNSSCFSLFRYCLHSLTAAPLQSSQNRKIVPKRDADRKCVKSNSFVVRPYCCRCRVPDHLDRGSKFGQFSLTEYFKRAELFFETTQFSI